MRRDKDGNKLFRKVTVKIVFPDKIFPDRTLVSHAGPRQGFHDGGITAILMQVAEQLDTLYPFWEFRSIELAPVGQTARHVFTFAGYRATPPAQVNLEDFSLQHPKHEESKELGPETAEDVSAEVASEASAI